MRTESNQLLTVAALTGVEISEQASAKPTWTDNRRRAVESYIAMLQRIMHLQDWRIVIDWKTKVDGEEAYATNTPFGNQRRCTIAFSDEFLSLSQEDQGQTLVHELVHCHLFQVHHQAEDGFDEVGSRAASKVFSVMMESTVECATDAIADVIASLVPPFVMPTE